MRRERLDAVLNLLDRQVVDAEGLMVCKVDDVELLERAGMWDVTGLLAGPPALLGRLGGRSGDRLTRAWGRLGLQRADRQVPWAVPIDLVADIDSAVRLSAGRDGLLEQQDQGTPAGGGRRRRLKDVLELTVVDASGEPVGGVLDVRVHRLASDSWRLRADGLIVGRGRPGGLLGYDRDAEQGPWLIGRVVRWLHRHSRYVPLESVGEIDWTAGTVRVTSAPEPLEPA